MDSTLNNLQRLICHKTQQTKLNQTKKNQLLATLFLSLSPARFKINCVLTDIDGKIIKDSNKTEVPYDWVA